MKGHPEHSREVCAPDLARQARAPNLRRTCAKLCCKIAGGLEQIRILLGHASIQSTERYLGTV